MTVFLLRLGDVGQDSLMMNSHNQVSLKPGLRLVLDGRGGSLGPLQLSLSPTDLSIHKIEWKPFGQAVRPKLCSPEKGATDFSEWQIEL